MKLTAAIFGGIILMTSMTMAQEDESSVLSVIPTPQKLISKNSRFKFGAGTRIVLGSDSREEQFAAQQLNDALAAKKETQVKVVAENSMRRLPASFIFIGAPTTEFGRSLMRDRKAVLTSQMKSEGYFLDADPSGIVLLAESEAGRFYGVMTLLQLLRTEKSASLKAKPELRLRIW